MEIQTVELTDAEANQKLHESRFVDGCWHDVIYDSEAERVITCSKCDSEHVMLSCSGKMEAVLPDYCNSYDAVIPVVQKLDAGTYIFNDKFSGCSYFAFLSHITPRYIVDALLEII